MIIWISQSMVRQYGTSAIRCRTIGTVMERFHSRSQQLCIHTKRVQLPQDWFGTRTLLPFHCFGTPRLRTGRHEKKGLYDDHSRLEIAKVYRYICWLVSLKWSRPSRDHASCPKSRDDYIQPGWSTFSTCDWKDHYGEAIPYYQMQKWHRSMLCLLLLRGSPYFRVPTALSATELQTWGPLGPHH